MPALVLSPASLLYTLIPTLLHYQYLIEHSVSGVRSENPFDLDHLFLHGLEIILQYLLSLQYPCYYYFYS